MEINDTIKVSIYGHVVSVKVLAIAKWSIDVQRLSDGKCFRVSGVSTP